MVIEIKLGQIYLTQEGYVYVIDEGRIGDRISLICITQPNHKCIPKDTVYIQDLYRVILEGRWEHIGDMQEGWIDSFNEIGCSADDYV